MKWTLLASGALALALALAGCGKQAGPPPATGAGPGPAQTSPAATATTPASTADARPALRVTTLAGADIDIAQWRGKWVIVNYWATWCGPCIKEMPELSALAAMREHIRVLGLAYDETSEADLRTFLETRPVAYPVARIDMYEPPADFGAASVLPATWLIRPDGRLARRYNGPVTARMLEEDIAGFGGPAPG